MFNETNKRLNKNKKSDKDLFQNTDFESIKRIEFFQKMK